MLPYNLNILNLIIKCPKFYIFLILQNDTTYSTPHTHPPHPTSHTERPLSPVKLTILLHLQRMFLHNRISLLGREHVLMNTMRVIKHNKCPSTLSYAIVIVFLLYLHSSFLYFSHKDLWNSRYPTPVSRMSM